METSSVEVGVQHELAKGWPIAVGKTFPRRRLLLLPVRLDQMLSVKF